MRALKVWWLVWWLGVVMRVASTASHVMWLISTRLESVSQRAATRRMLFRQDQEWRR